MKECKMANITTSKTRRLSYSHMLGRMYFQLLAQQKRGRDFSELDKFVSELRMLVEEHQEQALKKVA